MHVLRRVCARLYADMRLLVYPGHPQATPLATKQNIHFGNAASVAGVSAAQKSAAEIVLERKAAKKAAEEKSRAEEEAAKKNKYAGIPEWKKAMFLKRDAAEAEKAKPAEAIEKRRQEVEHMFDDLAPFQRERAIKKEKRRILQEEGIIL